MMELLQRYMSCNAGAQGVQGSTAALRPYLAGGQAFQTTPRLLHGTGPHVAKLCRGTKEERAAEREEQFELQKVRESMSQSRQ